jgi:hypothetical protein
VQAKWDGAVRLALFFPGGHAYSLSHLASMPMVTHVGLAVVDSGVHAPAASVFIHQ